MKEVGIFAQLERLAAACPWDEVDIWLCREPEGKISYTCHVHGNPKFGFDAEFASAATPQEAVDKILKDIEASPREPGLARDSKIAELQEQIRKLQAVEIGLPPYVANRELAQFIQPTIDT